MNLRALADGKLLTAVLQSVSLSIHATHRAAVHTSCRLFKKSKKPFYNKYAKQLQNRYRIYTGYANEILLAQNEKTFSHSEDMEDEDFEEELLNEGRRRRKAYLHSRKMRELTKGAGPRLLTWEQMEHIRFLKQTEPEEWDIGMLAHSFQVPEMVIRKVLRSKRVLSPHAQEKLDTKARENQGVARLPSPLVSNRSTSTSVIPVEEKQSLQTEEQWGLPDWKNMGWFCGYEDARTNSVQLRKAGHETSSEADDQHGVSWLDEEEEEFYSYLYRAEEDWWDGEDSGNHEEDDFEIDHEDGLNDVRTDDGKIFYDNEGDLLYRI